MTLANLMAQEEDWKVRGMEPDLREAKVSALAFCGDTRIAVIVQAFRGATAKKGKPLATLCEIWLS